MIKVVMALSFGFVLIFALATYWLMKPIEHELLSTANVSTSVNMTLYPAYVETVNYWPILGWTALLVLIVFIGYKIVKN